MNQMPAKPYATRFAMTKSTSWLSGATCVPESAAPKHVRDLLSPCDEIIAGFTPDVLFSKHARPYIARIAARRAFLDAHHVRFATDIKLAEDTAFLFEAYPHARKTVLSSAKLYNYRMNGESITHGLNSANATKAKLDQHLAAIEHILANWRENKTRQPLLGTHGRMDSRLHAVRHLAFASRAAGELYRMPR